MNVTSTLIHSSAARIDLPERSVQCVVTSPPYFSQRKYAGEQQDVWGGQDDCEHRWVDISVPGRSGGWDKSTLGTLSGGHSNTSGARRRALVGSTIKAPIGSAFCADCDAWRGSLGNEPTPDLYVEHLVTVFREVRRVLRDDGVLWLNLGDTYAANWSSLRSKGGAGRDDGDRERSRTAPPGYKPKDLLGIPWRVADALRAGVFTCEECGRDSIASWQLEDGRHVCRKCGRLQFALPFDRWYLRCDVIWSKPNGMPHSVRDRPTIAHEYLFLLAKEGRYYYDHDAIREPMQSGPSDIKKMVEGLARIGGRSLEDDDPMHAANAATNIGKKRGVGDPDLGRNRRSVWNIATVPYKGAHYATFPEALVEPCILAGSSPQACSECGAPYRRQVVKGTPVLHETAWSAKGAVQYDDGAGAMRAAGLEDGSSLKHVVPRITVGWTPGCTCGSDLAADDLEIIASPLDASDDEPDDDPTGEVGRAGFARERGDGEGQRLITRWEQRDIARQLARSPHRDELLAEVGADAFAHYVRGDRAGARPVPADVLERWVERGVVELHAMPEWTPPPPAPCLVLDPFNGTGTTGRVALRHGRSYVGVDISDEYLTEHAAGRLDRIQTVLDVGDAEHQPRRRRPATPRAVQPVPATPEALL